MEARQNLPFRHRNNDPHVTRNLFEEFRNLPQETRDAYHKCMSTDAIYKSAVPISLAAAGVMHYWGSVTGGPRYRHGPTICAGLLGYVLGKMIYATKCLQKHAPFLLDPQIPHRGTRQDTFQDGSFDENPFKVQTEDEPAWSSFDMFSNDNSDQFDTVSDDFQEDGSTMKRQANAKRYVSYDELRRQSRAEYYKKLDRQETTQKREVLDVSPPPSVDNGERDIWG